VIGGVEPAAPEPVEIGAAGLFHGAEEIGGRRALELPAAGIFAKRKVKSFTPQHRIAQHVIGGRRLAIGVRAQIGDRIRLRHDRLLVVRDHVRHQIARKAAGPGHVGVPFIPGDGIEEAVQPLVHPGPLAFIRIDRHREIDVPDLVDDDADEEHLFGERIGAAAILVQCGARPVEGHHRIFHPADRPVNRLRGGIGIIKAEA